MTTGPGKYDDVATMAREKTDAACVVLIVLAGDKGDGFSVQTTDPGTMFSVVPTVLRQAATQIESDAKGFMTDSGVQAQVEGYAAGLVGTDPRTCPYEKMTVEWNDWQRFHRYGTSVATATQARG